MVPTVFSLPARPPGEAACELAVCSCPSGRKRSHRPQQQTWPEEPGTCLGLRAHFFLLRRAAPTPQRQEDGKKAQPGVEHPVGH